MKKFCVLEQGRDLNNPLTMKKKDIFTTEFSNFYRLNWYTDEDPNAFLYQKGITWSEGRSLIYEKVPKIYDYYIVTDDDIDFQSSDPSVNIATKIAELLDEYNPISATFFDPDRWKKNDKSFPRAIDISEYLSRKVFPISIFDPQVFIFSKSFADVIFPIIYHGGSSTLRYANWACHHTYPFKQMCFSEVQVVNTRQELRKTQSKKKNYISPTEIRWLFNKDIKNKSLIMNVHQNQDSIADLRKSNLGIFNQEVDKIRKEFSLQDLANLYNISNIDFVYRKSIIDTDYIHKNNYNHNLFLWFMKVDSFFRKMGLSNLSKLLLSI